MANNPELLKMPLARDGQKSTIPETTDASTGLFSQQYGWQSINSLPPQAGGKAVKREDFNGAFNLLGGIAYYAQKGFTFKWSAEQDYYAGCVVIDDTDGLRYECIADVTANNTAPSADATHWQIFKAGTDIDAWFRQASTVYAVGDMRCYESLPYGLYLECTVGGTTSDSELTIASPASGNTVIDGTVTWKIRKISGLDELPIASSSTLGGVKIGTNISVSNGTISLLKSNVTNALGYTPPSSNGGIVAQSLGTNGYVKFNNGFILQWGTYSTSTQTTSLNVTFPIAFPNTCASVVCSMNGNYSGNDWGMIYIGITDLTKTGFTKRLCNARSSPEHYIAVGY